MKNKNGFTLIELLATIAILSILLSFVAPEVIKLFNDSKKQLFVQEVRNIYKSSESQMVSDSLKSNNVSEYNSVNSKVPINGGNDLEYKVILNENKKITSICVTNGKYIIKKDNNGTILSIDEINKDLIDTEDLNCISKEPLEFVWSKIDTDLSYFNDVIELPDKNFLAVGLTKETQPDAVAVKYDINGNIIWKNTYGNTSWDHFDQVFLMGDDKFIAFGTSYSRKIDNQIANGTPFPMIVVGNLSDGSQITIRKYLTSFGSNYYTHLTYPFGNIVKISDGFLGVGFISIIDQNSKEIPIIVKFDSSSNKVWEKQYDSENFLNGYRFYDGLEYESNKYAVIGTKNNNNGIIVKYDSNGNVIPSTFNFNTTANEFQSIKYLNNKIVITTYNNTFLVLDSNFEYQETKSCFSCGHPSCMLLNDLSYISGGSYIYKYNNMDRIWAYQVPIDQSISSKKVIYANNSNNIIVVGSVPEGSIILKFKVN